MVHAGAPTGAGRSDRDQRRPTADVARNLDRLLLTRYAPPSALVDGRLEILQLRGQTGDFLQPASGKPRNNLARMARPGLLAPLRQAIARARKELAPVRTEGVRVQLDGEIRACDLVVLPLTSKPELKEPLFVVLFEESAVPGLRGRPLGTRPRAPRTQGRAEHERTSTGEHLQTLIEEYARTNDELAVANGELVSGNQKLQRMNEALETAQVALQSCNRELTSINLELQSRNQELNAVNSDLANLLGAVDIPLLILDRGRRIRRFTPRARDILNVLAADVGRLVDDIRPNIQVVDLDHRVAQVIETGRAEASEVQDQDGHWHLLQIHPYQLPDGTTGGAILSLVNVDTFKHLIREAQRARLEAERANQAKDQFLATLSHELRSPLSVMMSYSQLLQRSELDLAKVKRASMAIERATKQQVQLIDDLLDVSRIIAGKLKMELRPVRLREVVKAALEVASALAERRSIALVTDLGREAGTVSGDPVRLQQVVTNLLTNALKFTPEGGKITVTLASLGKEARLTVTDTGIGIEADFLPHVFERFSQGDSSNTRRFGGLGLGLAIVRHLVEAHRGTVQACSEGTGRGSTFIVTLPLLSVREPAIAPTAPEAGEGDGPLPEGDGRPLRGVRILVVDDEGLSREAIADMLESTGAAVTAVGSAEEAMKAVTEVRPQVLVCDLAMPGEDGCTLVRHLRERGETIPAMALSALAGEDDRRRALLAGFHVHMAKPAELHRFTRTVAELARGAGMGAAPAGH